MDWILRLMACQIPCWQLEKANEQYNYLNTFKKVFPANFKIAYTAAAIPARIALENKNWEAAALELPLIEIDWDQFPWQRSILHFARAMGSVRSGNVVSAEKELAQLVSNQKELQEMNDTYNANQVKIQIDIVQAWIHFANGSEAEAITLMEEAANLEYNTTKHPVTPGEVLPAGELLGDLLLTENKPAEALKAYEYDITQHPNRFNGTYGAAIAANTLGDGVKASQYFNHLVELVEAKDCNRIELKEAIKYLSDVNDI